MAREFSRTERVADFLREELAKLILREIRDPRINMVMVTAVEVSRDLAHAKVFITSFGKESAEEAQPTVDALNKASGFLRSQLARDSRMRITPRLSFVYDTSVLRGSQLTGLIDKAIAADAELTGGHSEDDDDGSTP
ncbi:MAG: 30S ribosome-binding factor RbfA [Pseudomonadales bacterium]